MSIVEIISHFSSWIAVLVALSMLVAGVRLLWIHRYGPGSYPSLLLAMGMMSLLFGFAAIIISWSTAEVQKLTHDFLFTIGFILFFIAVYKISLLDSSNSTK